MVSSVSVRTSQKCQISTERAKTFMVFFDLYIFLIFILQLTKTSAYSDCGDFYDLAADSQGNIESPRFSKLFPPNIVCIWLIQAPSLYNVELRLSYIGERNQNNCIENVEVREGSRYSNLIAFISDNNTGLIVRSERQWLWIMFKSNCLTAEDPEDIIPLLGEFHTIYNGTTPQNRTIPYIEECRSYEFECRNRECVSMSYRCDGYNDCGCWYDCDEDMCKGLQISKNMQALISIFIGIVVFCVLCLLTYFIEGKNTWITSQAEAIREKEILAEKQRQRASRAFTKFIGSEKEQLLSASKSRANISTMPSSFSVHHI